MDYHNNPFSTFLTNVIDEVQVNTAVCSSPDSSPKSVASRSPPNIWLPSYLSDGGVCGVCGDAATGYHYRSLSCEGCKGFFRRTVQRGLCGSYVCRLGGNCTIDRANRNTCRHCRYYRCLIIGMAPSIVLSEKERVAKRQLMEENRERKNDNFSSDPLKIHSTVTPQDQTIIQSLVSAYNDAFSKDNTSQMGCDTVTKLNIEGSSEGEELAVWEGLLQRLTPAVTRIVTFVRNIPGFITIYWEDQVLLLRGCVAEILFLRTCLRYNTDTQSILLRSGKHLFRSQVEGALGGTLWCFLGPVFELAATVSRLKLDDSEAAMLVALLAVQTDRIGIINMETVEGVQDSLLAACKRHIISSYPEQPIRWAKMMMKLTHIRNVASQHSMPLLSTQAMPTINKLVIQLFGEAALLIPATSL